MDSITEFLEARIAEDEAVAARHLKAWANADDDVDNFDGALADLSTQYSLRHGTEYMSMDIGYARVLAECAAKRAILANIPRNSDLYDAHAYTSAHTFYALAAVYADHPDYRQEWAL